MVKLYYKSKNINTINLRTISISVYTTVYTMFSVSFSTSS